MNIKSCNVKMFMKTNYNLFEKFIIKRHFLIFLQNHKYLVKVRIFIVIISLIHNTKNKI